MEKPKIKLEEERNFSGVLNATFAFIGQEFKPLFRAMVLVGGIPIIVSSIIAAFYIDDTLTNLLSSFGRNAYVENTIDSGMIGILYFTQLITMLFITILGFEYFKLYKEKGSGNFDTVDIWMGILKDLGSSLGYSIVAGMAIFFATLLFIIPGIYISIPLTFIIIVKIVEKNDFSSTWSRCFLLVKNNWWVTLGLLIIISIIYNVFSMVFSFPAAIYAGIKGYLEASNSGEMSATPIIITTAISSIGSMLLYPIYIVAIGFQYFSLVEKKDNTLLIEKIEQIGKTDEE